MVTESGNRDLGNSEDEAISVPDIITDLVADTAVPAIPAPVRRNLLKAFGQLCSAAIDYPVAYLTGKADEKRAETAARIKLINTSATQIAQQMQTDPEYARVAVQKFGHRVLREQVNLDLISQRAASAIRDSEDSVSQSVPEDSGGTINDDWLNAFEVEARQKSTEEMQDYFGRVLAGEIRKPGSFSTRAIKILGSLDQDIANHFVRLCSISISTQFEQDVRVPALGGNAGSNALQEYGLNFSTLNLLNEHGLIISDYNSWWEFTPCVALPGDGNRAVCIPLLYQGGYWILMPKSERAVSKKLRIHGVALTQSGRELLTIVKIEPIEDYSEALVQFFEKNGFQMIGVGDRDPRIVSINAAGAELDQG